VGPDKPLAELSGPGFLSRVNGTGKEGGSVKNLIDKGQNQHSPSSEVVALGVAVPGVQDYDTITVDRDLLRQQIDFMEHLDSSSLRPEAKDCIEGILGLLEGIHDLGWPPEEEEEEEE